LPFVMAFVAAGIKLQFYYYYSNNNNVPVRVRIGNTINLGTTNRMNNFKALQHTINAIRIIRTWDLKQYIRRPEIKLYEVIQRRNGTTVTINPKKMDIFRICTSWRYMEIPKDEDELRYAIWSVFKSVMILHANEIVHRDIRWENVMRLTDNSWVLIDFEEAAPIGRGNRRTPILNIAAPEYRGMESDPCRAAGDIWMIGNLLNDLRILQIQLSVRARNFRDRLTQQNHDERPSAADAIDDDRFSDM
ncbi:13753_t:CDS:2, partial [Rhizophagus irregularis]